MTVVDMFIISGAFLFGIFTASFIFVVLRYLNNLDEFGSEDPVEIRLQHSEAFSARHREMKGE